MRVDPVLHHEHSWRVHTLASDFELLDVWEIAIDDPRLDRFDPFFDRVIAQGLETDSAIVRALIAIRGGAGKLFGWDSPAVRRPIPGCTETSLVERLSDADRASTRIPPGTKRPTQLEDLQVVYRFDHEALLELSNATIHALIHLSWAPGPTARPRLAVYIKSRGVRSRIYMAAIQPFRHLFVYPAWTRRLAATEARRA